jgi:hypothetical protein
MVSDLKRLLEVAAETTPGVVDPAADLARARRARRARTVGRIRVGVATIAIAVVVAVGLTRTGTTPHHQDPVAASPVRLVAASFEADPYTFDLTPTGWHVQAQNPYAVTNVPDDGSTSGSPDVFVGKLVILFDQNPLGGGCVESDGRQFCLRTDSEYTTISTPTRADEPPGVVRIQYPDDAGWTRASMLAFLGSVHVGPGALPGLG